MDKTLKSLQSALRVISSIRASSTKPDINRFEHSVFATDYGATTGHLSFGGELHLNYEKAAIGYFVKGEKKFDVTINEKTQRELFNEVVGRLKIKVNDEKIGDSEKLKVNSVKAKKYAALQYQMHTALSLFRYRLSGQLTQVALWPHGFDLAFIWFKKGTNERKHPHMQFGFSPFGNYLFFYAWPVPKDITKIKLPSGAKWNTDWPTTGASIPIKIFSKEPNSTQAIADTLWSNFQKIKF